MFRLKKPAKPGAMELRQQLYIRSWLENFNWKLELELHNEFGVQFGADSSIVLEKETVFVIWPDRWSRTTSETYTLWGQIEIVDDFREWLGVKIFGKMAHGEREFEPCHVISTSRGPAFQAVRCLQRAFRRRRYLKWYHESGGWDGFVKEIVVFAQRRGRFLRKFKYPFCPGPSWGYVLEPAVAEFPDAGLPGICIPALGQDSTENRKFRQKIAIIVARIERGEMYVPGTRVELTVDNWSGTQPIPREIRLALERRAVSHAVHALETWSVRWSAVVERGAPDTAVAE